MSIEAKETALFAAYERIVASQQTVGFAKLDRADQLFIVIWELEAEVNNGGFSQWMFNSFGGQPELAVVALRELGASAVADVCERFFALLPGGRPESDRDARQSQLEAAEAQHGEKAFEDACSALEEEFYSLEDDLRDRLWSLVRS